MKTLPEILNQSPTDKEVPDDLWKNIHATWTGLWLDAWGEWDELPASEVFPIADFLTDERIAWLKQAIAKELMGCLPEKLPLVKRHPDRHQARVAGYNDALSEVRARLTAFIGKGE